MQFKFEGKEVEIKLIEIYITVILTRNEQFVKTNFVVLTKSCLKEKKKLEV